MTNVFTKMKEFNLSKIMNFIFNNESISARRKVFNSLWSIFFGLLIAFIFISSTAKPSEVIQEIFNTAFSELKTYDTLLLVVIFTFGGIAVGTGFKAGIFNIGIPSQMMTAGGVSLLILINSAKIGEPVSHGFIFLAFLVGILFSAFIGFIAGVLKAFFKINEVISTILLNWIIFYLFYQIFSAKLWNFYLGDDVSQSITLPTFTTSNNFIIMMLFVVVIFATLMWFVFQKTTIGYKIKMSGLNLNASKYAGTNEKFLVISSLSFSALIAGVAGFLWYVILQKNMLFSARAPLKEGFDTILIALLAYNSPIGSILVSLFYSIIFSGSSNLQSIDYNLDSNSISIIFGIVVYLSAISIVFTKFKPLTFIYKVYLFIKAQVFWKSKQKEQWIAFKKEKDSKLKTSSEKGKNSKLLEAKVQIIEEKINYLNNEYNQRNLALFPTYLRLLILHFKHNCLSKKIIKQSIAQHKSEWKKLKTELENEFLNNYKNIKALNSTKDKISDDETLAEFSKIHQKRKQLDEKLDSLGYNKLKHQKQKHKANIFVLNTSFKKNLKEFLAIEEEKVIITINKIKAKICKKSKKEVE
ncbi:ABC transporter permease [Mycoplasma hyorhinis]|uniref:ABC transporter permease n=1 Tax=Mesomycoplasma hyorhinis TaxID=2100 RepID=UPI00136BCE5D|nr:ABC transporter permease [Mesomycoplasma hyorhinis]MXR08751.1 ABC transporter permease [Mesomycoplasma hyorhinis]